MADFTHVLPRAAVPALRVPLAGGGEFDLATARPERFTLVAFYRGLHCPICAVQLAELERRLAEFTARGVDVVAASMDERERAERAKAEWQLPNLRIGYALDAESARAWGLYLSPSNGMTPANVVEPDVFSEPGLFLVRADGTLYFSSVQTMPFARPHAVDLLGALDYVIENDYPARGELAAVPAAAR